MTGIEIIPGEKERIELMSFEQSLKLIKGGFRCSRIGWNGRGMYIALQTPTPESKMTKPYIYMRTVQGDYIPWLASQSDLLSEDWVVSVGV